MNANEFIGWGRGDAGRKHQRLIYNKPRRMGDDVHKAYSLSSYYELHIVKSPNHSTTSGTFYEVVRSVILFAKRANRPPSLRTSTTLRSIRFVTPLVSHITSLRSHHSRYEHYAQGRFCHASYNLSRSVTTVAVKNATSCHHSHKVIITIHTLCYASGVIHNGYPVVLSFMRMLRSRSQTLSHARSGPQWYVFCGFYSRRS